LSIEPPSADADATPQAFVLQLAASLEVTRQAELERTLRRLDHLDEADKVWIDELSRQLVRSVIGLPIDRLKQADHHLSAARDLFGLN
jgi:glutamyl-tRNA reductase